MKIIKFLSCFAAMALIMASCNSSSNYVEPMQVSPGGCYNTVTDVTSGTTTHPTNIGYNFEFDYTDNLVTVTISGLKLGDVTYPAMKLSNITWGIDNAGWRVAAGTNVVPEIQGYGEVPVFASFKLSVLDRILGQNYLPIIVVSYTIDDKYTVTTIPRVLSYFGKTTITNLADGKKFETDATWYQLEMNPEKNLATLYVNGAKFAFEMPAMDMSFGDLNFIASGERVTFDKDALTPGLKQGASYVPMSAFPITDLGGQLMVKGTMDLRFKCDAKGASYEVIASCGVLSTSNNGQNPGQM